MKHIFRKILFTFFAINYSLCYGQVTEAVLLHKTAGASNPFTHSYTFTTDHTQCGTANTSNFTCTVDTILTDLKSVAKGGSVQSYSVSGISNTDTVPNDVVFSTSSAFSGYMSWEVVKYNPGTGRLIAHVLLSTLTYNTNVSFYIGIGSASISTFQGGSKGAAWAAAYQGIWHFKNGNTLSAKDATSNGNDGTIQGCASANGILGGGSSSDKTAAEYVYTGSSNSINTNITNGSNANFTISCWIYISGTSNNTGIIQIGLPNSSQGTISFGFFTGSQATLTLRVNGAISAPGQIQNNTGLSNNTWYYIMAEGNGSNIYIYVANSSTTSPWVAGAFTYTLNNDTGPTNIGMYYSNTYSSPYLSWMGIIAEMRVSNMFESTSQFTAENNNQKIGSTFLTLSKNY